ncbi:MAG: TerB family tellurite resistance protein [Proteobacteria bacterium]|nr:TerB family tellurite resistance protein [Pseudomonadota bacterium]
MASFFKFAKEALAVELDKFRNRQFLDATMAASALVSMADGDANITEINILDQALETIQELKIYDPHDAMDLYRDYIDALRADPGATRDTIMRTIGRIREDPHAARLLIRVCVAIGKADEDFSGPEKAVITELCQSLGLDPDELGL